MHPVTQFGYGTDLELMPCLLASEAGHETKGE